MLSRTDILLTLSILLVFATATLMLAQFSPSESNFLFFLVFVLVSKAAMKIIWIKTSSKIYINEKRIEISHNLCQPIFKQCSTSIPPENIRKPVDVFRGYRSDRSGTLLENGLIEIMANLYSFFVYVNFASCFNPDLHI